MGLVADPKLSILGGGSGTQHDAGIGSVTVLALGALCGDIPVALGRIVETGTHS